MKCSICAAKNRNKIDESLVTDGATIRGIARTFHVSEDSLARHVKNGHVKAKIAKVQKAQELIEADSLLNKLLRCEAQINEIITHSHSAEDFHLELKAHREMKGFLELQGRVLGSFNDKLKVMGNKPIQIEWVTVNNDAKNRTN